MAAFAQGGYGGWYGMGPGMMGGWGMGWFGGIFMIVFLRPVAGSHKWRDFRKRNEPVQSPGDFERTLRKG